MRKYEAMIILRPDLAEEERKNLFNQLHEIIAKHKGSVLQGAVWAEKRKLAFHIKRYHEGMFYLLNFTVEPQAISEIRQAYRLNENIMRSLITLLS